MPTPAFRAAKSVFDKAVADGWAELDIACIHDQICGESAFNRRTGRAASRAWSPRHDLVARHLPEGRHRWPRRAPHRRHTRRPTGTRALGVGARAHRRLGTADDILRGVDFRDAPLVDHDTLLAPLHWPRKVICAGQLPPPRQRDGRRGADQRLEAVLLPQAADDHRDRPDRSDHALRPDKARFDWEAELAVVIGIGRRDIPAQDALDTSPATASPMTSPPAATTSGHRAGRRVHLRLVRLQVHRRLAAAGPGITPAFQVPDPQDLRMRFWLNGELQQDDSTADMICPVAELVAAASEVVTLEPGDVILTGTPSGVGAGRGCSSATATSSAPSTASARWRTPSSTIGAS